MSVYFVQAHVRCWIAQQMLARMRLREHAATYIQKVWRGSKVRRWYQNFRRALIAFQVTYVYHRRGLVNKCDN